MYECGYLGNSNLHYACAYGWWFCMQVLIEAGADANAANEWKLTPLRKTFNIPT